jgi:hypothetical protein
MKKILIVSPIECYPEFYGSSARIGSFIKIIEQIHDVDLLYLHLPERSFNLDVMKEELGESYVCKEFKEKTFVKFRLRFKKLLSLLMFRGHTVVRVDDFIECSDIAFFKKVYDKYNPDILIINYTYYSKLFDYTKTNCVKILDTHDSIFNRFKLIYNDEKAYKNLRVSLKDEINCLNRSDIVLSIQNKEEAFFKANGCSSEVITIGHIKDFYQSDIDGFKFKILYIGANYSANVESLQNFLVYVWPRICNHFLNNIELLVVGDIKDSFQVEGGISFKNVNFLGRIGDLNEIYNQVDFSINPILYGSGLKIKNIESLSMGKPIVTMPYGLDGLECFLARGVYVVSDVADWIEIFEKLFNREYYKKAIDEIQNLYVDYLDENKDLLINLIKNN